MEILQRTRRPASRHRRCQPVLAELHDHQLAKRVVQVGRVVGATCGLLASATFVGIGLFTEAALAVFHLPALRMQADGAQQPAVAHQRLQQLANVRGRRAHQALLPHHLFGVVRPAFGIGIAHEEPAHGGLSTVGMQELQEMARPYFMNTGSQQQVFAR